MLSLMAARGGKRAEILAAARRLGPAATVDALLGEAGAGIGTFYHHFPNGREDVRQALEAAAETEYDAGLLRVLQRNREAETGIKALVHHHARWAAEQPDLARLLPPRPSSDLVRATRAWARSTGLEGVGAEELLAVTLAPVRVAGTPDRLAAAAWAAVRELASG